MRAPMEHSTDKSTSRLIAVVRRLVGAAVLLLVFGILLRTFLVQGVFVPVRVVSGSMADALEGDHYRVRCDDCGFAFDFAAENPPTGDRAVCPNCGFAGNDVSGRLPCRGDRILIDKASLAVRAPRRWEVVVARRPDDPARLAVKRVVGLPGERVAIRHGDVYIDGKIARKTLGQLRSMALLVHDDAFRPKRGGGRPLRWQAESPGNGWRAENGRYVFRKKGQNSFSDGEKESRPLFCWLTYRHRPCTPSPLPRTAESPVMDNYGYNQGLARGLQYVSDLMLSVRLKMASRGRAAIKAHDGRDTFEVRLDGPGATVALLQNGRPVSQTRWRGSPAGRAVQIELALCDRQVLLAIDGRAVMSYAYQPSRRPWRPTPRPLAIGGGDATLEVGDLRVYRDVYYLNPVGRGADWAMDRPLASDELFLLGDNSPVSEDSRSLRSPWPRKLLVGRVWPPP